MSTTHGTTWLERTSVSTWHVPSFIWKCRDAFLERRERQKLRATLSELSDGELMDIGTTRGEIDYVASHRGMDPPEASDQANGCETCQRRTAKWGPPTSDRGQTGTWRGGPILAQSRHRS